MVVQAWKAWRAWVGNSGEHPLVATLVSGLIVSQEAPRFSSFALSPSNPANTPFAPIFPSLTSPFGRVCIGVPLPRHLYSRYPLWWHRPLDPTIRQLTPLPPLKLHRRHVGRYSRFLPSLSLVPLQHSSPFSTTLPLSLCFFFSCLATQQSNSPPIGYTAFQVLLRREIRGGGVERAALAACSVTWNRGKAPNLNKLMQHSPTMLKLSSTQYLRRRLPDDIALLSFGCFRSNVYHASTCTYRNVPFAFSSVFRLFVIVIGGTRCLNRP